QMASACAVACHAETLIFLTDVPGVKNAASTLMPWQNTKQNSAMVESAEIAGGMLPKLMACGQALRKGVGRVRILPAAQADNLPQFYLTRLDGGTEVIVA